MSKPRIGDRIPDFTLPDADGKPVSSASLLGHGPVVIYFYPRDETAGCTAQACAFRDQHEDFLAAEARVVGISVDPPASHRGFAEHHRLPFTLLADTDGAVHRLFGVDGLLGLVRGRETFVVDAQGIVRHHTDSLLFATRHVREALAAVRSMKSAPAPITSAGSGSTP